MLSSRDHRVLTAHVLGTTPEALLLTPRPALSTAQEQQLQDLTRRRAAGEPLSRLVGKREFWSLDLKVTPDVLDPRSDSETLVEAVLALTSPEQSLTLLDLGTGSGALSLALLTERPRLKVTAVDISDAALAVAKENAAHHKLQERITFQNSNWFDNVEGQFDILISNPPYIPAAEIATLDRAVKDYDPRLALDGGADGLDDYRRILQNAQAYLRPNGFMALELGAGQRLYVQAIAQENGWSLIKTHNDLAGHERVIVLKKVVSPVGLEPTTL